MEFSRKNNSIVVGILILSFLLYFYAIPVSLMTANFFGMLVSNYQYAAKKVHSEDFKYATDSSPAAIVPLRVDLGANSLQKNTATLTDAPAVVRALYVTGWSAGTKNYLRYLESIFETTQINALVIDVKDATGIVSYATDAPKAKEYKAYHAEIGDIDALIKNLHGKGIYVIGRIVVFEDPVLAKNRPDLAVYDTKKTVDVTKPVVWENRQGLAWVDPASTEVWDYNIEIARDAANRGFDEINFDYIRFPTDGQEEAMGFPIWDKKIPKNFVIKNFFQTLREGLPQTRLSADIFGQTTTNTDDMGIGQIFEDALGYFDYVCPMIYPSHYISGFIGYKNPAEYPYQIVTYATDGALARQKVYDAINNKKVTDATENALIAPAPEQTQRARIRPWLQDFNLGAVYDAEMVKKEIQAVKDSMGEDFSGFMLWNPSNVYSVEAVAKDIRPVAY